MPIALGVDLGTTKITCIAVDALQGEILAVGSAANGANITRPEDQSRGFSEWNADLILATSLKCIRSVAEQLGTNASDVMAIGLTGQQHGMVLVDPVRRQAVSPLINWQDRRALQLQPDGRQTWLQAARNAIGPETWKRTGCWLHPGFMATTLYELSSRGQLPAQAQALFIMDFFAAILTGQNPVSEPSAAGSSGVFNVRTRQWDAESIAALGLPRSVFPEICEADRAVGNLTNQCAAQTGLAEGIPVFAAIGDHQASFLGSVADRHNSILVNVGTGAQVAVYTDGLSFELPIELRPFPFGGNLLSNVGLAGGWSYQVLEQFFRNTAESMFQIEPEAKLYETMTRLAAGISAGADGLRCEPRFAGTRLDPTVRGSMTGLSPQNFTAAHLARAVLEGMSRSLHEGFLAIQKITEQSPGALIAAGNGLRENQLLSQIVSQAFGLPMTFTKHREEAAYGASIVASVAAKLYPNLDGATKAMIHVADRTSTGSIPSR